MENLVVATEKKLVLDDFLSQVRIALNSPCKQILNVFAKVCLTSTECLGNVASVTGKITVSVVYQNDEDLVDSAETIYDFVEKQRADFSLSDVFASDKISVESINVSTNEILCTVSHAVEVCGIYKYELPVISNDENEFVLKKTTFDSLKLVSVSEDNFVVSEEVETNRSGLQVLSSKADVVLNDIACAVDKMVLEGKIVSEVVCLENGSIVQISKDFEFKQEISAENVVPNMVASSNICVKNITVTPEEKDDKTTLVFAIDLYSKNYTFDQVSYEIANDMFSIKNEIQTTYDFLTAKNNAGNSVGEDSCLIQADVSNIEGFDDMVGVFDASAKVLAVAYQEEKILVTVSYKAKAIYKTTLGMGSVDVFGENVIEIENENKKQLKDFEILASVSSFKVKAGKDLEVMLKSSYFAEFETVVEESFVKSFEVQGEKNQNGAGIKVYVARQGQTVFDVAKILNVQPEIITSQNQVDDVFEQGEKIYVYSPANLA